MKLLIEKNLKFFKRPLHSKMYKAAAAAAMQDRDTNIQDIYKFTGEGGEDCLDCKETPSDRQLTRLCHGRFGRHIQDIRSK